jgi:TonB family protein
LKKQHYSEVKNFATLLTIAFFSCLAGICFADERKAESTAEHCVDHVIEQEGVTWKELMTSFEGYMVEQGYLEEGDTNTYKAYFKVLKAFSELNVLPPVKPTEESKALIEKLKTVKYITENTINYKTFYNCYMVGTLISEDNKKSDIVTTAAVFQDVKDVKSVSSMILASGFLTTFTEKDLKKSIHKKTIILAFYGNLLCGNVHLNDNEINCALPPPPPKTSDTSEEVFDVIEDMPEFPGGLNAMYRWLGANVTYPKQAQENKEIGKVYVNFIVEKNGSISSVKIIRGVSPLLDAEGVRVVKAMPDWKPGVQKGKKVRVRYTLPLVFKLPPETKETK